ncbi:MAG: hypothetical protein GY849_02575 [Deltaproteobacteria bacterium]|nr:hypothetical protein [Deltaproteobacteria bacterium]
MRLEPFIKLKKQYRIEKEKIKVCEKHGKSKKHDKFCSICGNEIIEKEIDIEYRIWTDDIIGNDNFSEHEIGEFVYLMTNKKNVCSKYSSIGENEIISLNKTDIKNLKSEFEIYHSKDVELLKTKLNVDIEIDFGLLYSTD